MQAGTPQGGVISLLLANIRLHEVLDVWFEREVGPRLHSRAVLVRGADDVAILFSREDDARHVMSVLPNWLRKYGLTLHPEKSRLVEFRPPSLRPPLPGGGCFSRCHRRAPGYDGAAKPRRWRASLGGARTHLERSVEGSFLGDVGGRALEGLARGWRRDSEGAGDGGDDGAAA